ncbi:MAG: beta strand repeat-containing protein [Acidimicrobiales bacterium]
MHDRSEAGDTLIEVLLALVVLALASLALLVAFSTSIAASAEHRRLASDDTVLATASQEVISAIQNQSSLFSAACATPITSYPYFSSGAGFPLPAPYATKTTQTGYDVQYLTLNPTLNQYPVLWWSASAGNFTSTCVPNVPQLITISLVGTAYTNSFVVNYPIGSSGASAGSGSANQLVFLNSIVGGYAGSPFTTQPIVAVEHNGVPVTTDLSPVTLSISSGVGVLSGCTGNEVLGVVTFSDCTIGTGGTFQLEATDGSLTPAFSNSFTVTSSDFQLAFTTEPAGGASGSAFSTPPVVAVENNSGSVNTSWQGTVTITSSGGEITNCPQATTVTSVTLTVVNGLATVPSGSSGCNFSGGYFYNPNSSPQITATQYTLTATANPNTASDAAVPAFSTAFSVSSFGPAAKLSFTVQPAGVASSSASAVFTGQPTVTVEDAFGNVVTSANNAISLAMFQGSTNETLSGCSSSPNHGTYVFSGCHATADNNNLYLTATSNGLSPATSANFNITGVASTLLFTTSPTAGASASTFTVQPVLVYEDAGGNVVTAETNVVTLAVSPTGGTLSTCTGLTPNAGVVNVGNCVFTGLVGTPYTMTASGGGLTSSPSAAFSPTAPGPATQLVFTTEPVAGASQSTLATQPVVKVEDSAGNVVSSSTASIVLTSSGSGVIASCTGLTASAGVVNTSNCTFGGVVGTTYYLTASSGTLSTATSNGISPTGPGPMSQIVLGGCAASITSTSTCTLSATLKDMFGNIETADNTSVVTFIQVSGSGSLTGLSSTTVASGTTSDVVTGTTAGPVAVDASGDGVTSNQVAFTVNAAPGISTTTLPSATRTGGYTQTLTGTNGTTPYSWTVTTGTLPSGLSLSSSGVISGTVGATATTQTFTVTLTDADGVTATQPLTITVSTALVMTAYSPPGGSKNSAYNGGTGYQFAATGGAGTLTWTENGSLPPGLTLSISGLLSGTPTSSGTYNFNVLVTDANGANLTRPVQVKIT